jgi:hypothetical protein
MTTTEKQRRPKPRSLWPPLLAAGVVIVLVVLGSAFVPRWWAHRVGDYANESFTRGIGAGLVLGFVFTLLPLAVAWNGVRRIHSWRGKALVLVAAAILAAPNLLTLSVVVGTGNAAHAGDRTLDVEAPGFRGASLAGAIVGAALVAAPIYLLSKRRRDRARVSPSPPRAR